MARRGDTMNMLMRAMEGSALVGGMYGSALEGGAVNTKGKIKRSEGKSTMRSEDVYNEHPANVAVFQKVGRKLAKGEKRPYVKVPLPYADYVNRILSRQAGSQANDQVISKEIKDFLAANPGRERLSGEELLLLKYRVRNKTKAIKKALRAGRTAEEIKQNKNPDFSRLADPAFRAQFGGEGRQRGYASDYELKLRKEARESLANSALTRSQYNLQLREKYKLAKNKAKMEGHGRTAGRRPKSYGPVSRGAP